MSFIDDTCIAYLGILNYKGHSTKKARITIQELLLFFKRVNIPTHIKSKRILNCRYAVTHYVWVEITWKLRYSFFDFLTRVVGKM